MEVLNKVSLISGMSCEIIAALQGGCDHVDVQVAREDKNRFASGEKGGGKI